MGSDEPPIDQECVEGYLFQGTPPRILILRRPPERGGIWVPVSGKVDPSDSDFASALRREIVEETGITHWRRLFPLRWEVPFEGPEGRRWRLHAFGVELEEMSSPTLSQEHDAHAWVDASEAVRRLHYEDNKEAIRKLLRFLKDAPASPNV